MKGPIWRAGIDHGGHLAAKQGFRRIVFGHLGRRFPHPDFGAEINAQLESRLARHRERLDGNDGAHADVDFQEIIEGNLRHQNYL